MCAYQSSSSAIPFFGFPRDVASPSRGRTSYTCAADVDLRLEIRQEIREPALLSSLSVVYPNISHDAHNDFAACTGLRFINTAVFYYFFMLHNARELKLFNGVSFIS